MGEDTECFLPVLELMRKWQWVRHDPDGFLLTLGLDLSEVVNRLAMQGERSPHLAVLALLCGGQLIATGDFTWRKFHWGNFFQRENFCEELAMNQWRTLQTAIEDEQRELEVHGFPFIPVNLEKLGLAECSVYEWNFRDNRFSTAMCPPDTPVHDKSYFEEWFSAWNIEIRFPDVDADASECGSPHETVKAAPVGRPFAAWWPDFVAELVAYTVEVGLPPGIGHQGQSEVIKEVCARLQERGKEEPSRSQIQEAVNAVLRRMRSAGN